MCAKIRIFFTHIIMQTAVHAKAYEKDPEKKCEVYKEDSSKQCYTKEILISMPHSPHQLAFDTESNTLYFSFSSSPGIYIPALLKLDTNQLIILPEIKDAFTITYDAINKEIYFGGTYGIYRFNSKVKSFELLNISNLDIWWLFIKNDIYFVMFPSMFTYIYKNATIKMLPELSNTGIQQMVIDKNDNKIFTNTSGLYGIKPNETHTHKHTYSPHKTHCICSHEELMREAPRFLNMALDNRGHVFVCSDDGIYSVSKMVQKVKRLLNINGVLGFTFDKSNNVVYSDSREIIRLVPLDKGAKMN